MELTCDRRPPGPLVERLLGNRSVWSGYWSLVVHLALFLLLALLVSDGEPASRRIKPILIDTRGTPGEQVDLAAGGESGPVMVAPAAAAVPDAVEQEPIHGPTGEAVPEIAAVDAIPVEPVAPMPEAVEASPPRIADAPRIAAGPKVAGAAAAVEAAAASSPTRPGTQGRGRFEGRYGDRRGEGRASAVRRNGGNAASEAAVEAGLAWLAAHQANDGSWRCDLSGCRCDGGCRDAGTVASTTASTAIALLPFLGAGHTHETGEHQQTVSRGIYYLANRMKQTPFGGDLCEGTMYGQGLATLVFAEAFAMTGDDLLGTAVDDCIRFIESAQDRYGGGWRYLPGQPGDITVTAWQLAALKSGALAGRSVRPHTIDGAVRFLDRVQSMEGAAYGYRSPSAKHSTSAIGLLCRMYTGWKPGDPRIDRGIERLASRPPDPDAIYENFYLSQVLLQADHPAWPRWNSRLRDSLVRLQARAGHETGSWSFDDPETAPGGRLGHTALAVLVLEVYYRLLPIYGERAVESGF